MIMLRNTVSGKIVRFMVVEALLILFFIITAGIQNNIHAASLSESQRNELKSMFLEMLETADTSEHDISKYKFTTYLEVKEIFEEVRSNEGELASFCYTVTQVDTVKSGKYITKVSLDYLENAEDFEKNYATVKENVNNILDGLTDDMSDADKALHLHEGLISISTPCTSNITCRYEAGPLIFGIGNCSGYHKAYNYLLKRAGIEYGTSKNSGHVWNLVKLDGEWYHVDVTWDDPTLGLDVDHKFFLKNDYEFKNDPIQADKHLNYTSKDNNGNNISASSTKYSDSFIHNVKNVGIMTFKDGYWQYSKDGKTYRGRLTDTEAQEVIEKTETAEDENIGSEAQEPSDEEADEEDEEDEEDLSPWTTIIGAPAPSTPEPEPESDVVAEPEPETESEVVAEPEPETESEVIPEPEPEPIVETTAKFYLCRGSRTNYKASNYINLGKGTITKTERLLDDEDAIIAALGSVPEYSSYLADDQRVYWYSVKKEGDGWHVDGQIVTVEKTQTEEPETTVTEEPAAEEVSAPEEPAVEEVSAPEEPAVEEVSAPEEPAAEEVSAPEEPETETVPEKPVVKPTTAKFYLCKGSRTNYKPSNYINLGRGTITRTERLLDDEEAILAALGDVPEYTSYLSEEQHVYWYSIKKEGDGWHVDGQIISE